jgi:hypothetical protein
MKNIGYEFKQPFESPVKTCTSFYIGILAQKAISLGRLLAPRWQAPLFDPLLMSGDHLPAPLSLTHYRLTMCVAVLFDLPGEVRIGTLARGGEIVTFEVMPGCPNKCTLNSIMMHCNQCIMKYIHTGVRLGGMHSSLSGSMS